MTIQEWKNGLENEARKYGLELNDVVPEDHIIQKYINDRNWSPKDEMDYRAEKYDLKTMEELLGPWGGY